MLVYSVLFAVVYFGGAFGVGWLVETFAASPPTNLSFIGHLLALLGAVLVGWVFVKRHKRMFTVPESRRVVSYCMCWVFLVEAFGVWANADMFQSLSLAVVGSALAFAFLFDALIVWASFRYVVRTLMRRQLAGAKPGAGV